MSLEEHCAALAADMIDNEIAWIVRRLPGEEERTPFHQAVKKEAERRGIDH